MKELTMLSIDCTQAVAVDPARWDRSVVVCQFKLTDDKGITWSTTETATLYDLPDNVAQAVQAGIASFVTSDENWQVFSAGVEDTSYENIGEDGTPLGTITQNVTLTLQLRSKTKTRALASQSIDLKDTALLEPALLLLAWAKAGAHKKGEPVIDSPEEVEQPAEELEQP